MSEEQKLVLRDAAPLSVSTNNRLILEVYQSDRSLQTTERNGLAFVKQKVNLVGLKLLVDARLNDGTYISKGSKAYIKEGILHNAEWAKVQYEADVFPGQKFHVVDFAVVDMVVPG